VVHGFTLNCYFRTASAALSPCVCCGSFVSFSGFHYFWCCLSLQQDSIATAGCCGESESSNSWCAAEELPVSNWGTNTISVLRACCSLLSQLCPEISPQQRRELLLARPPCGALSQTAPSSSNRWKPFGLWAGCDWLQRYYGCGYFF